MKLAFIPITDKPVPGLPAFISRWTMKRLDTTQFGPLYGMVTLWPAGHVTVLLYVGSHEFEPDELQEMFEFMNEIKAQHRLALRADQVHRDLETSYESTEGRSDETATGVDGTFHADCGGVEVPDFTLSVG